MSTDEQRRINTSAADLPLNLNKVQSDSIESPITSAEPNGFGAILSMLFKFLTGGSFKPRPDERAPSAAPNVMDTPHAHPNQHSRVELPERVATQARSAIRTLSPNAIERANSSITGSFLERRPSDEGLRLQFRAQSKAAAKKLAKQIGGWNDDPDSDTRLLSGNVISVPEGITRVEIVHTRQSEFNTEAITGKKEWRNKEGSDAINVSFWRGDKRVGGSRHAYTDNLTLNGPKESSFGSSVPSQVIEVKASGFEGNGMHLHINNNNPGAFAFIPALSQTVDDIKVSGDKNFIAAFNQLKGQQISSAQLQAQERRDDFMRQVEQKNAKHRMNDHIVKAIQDAKSEFENNVTNENPRAAAAAWLKEEQYRYTNDLIRAKELNGRVSPAEANRLNKRAKMNSEAYKAALALATEYRVLPNSVEQNGGQNYAPPPDPVPYDGKEPVRPANTPVTPAAASSGGGMSVGGSGFRRQGYGAHGLSDSRSFALDPNKASELGSQPHPSTDDRSYKLDSNMLNRLYPPGNSF